MDIESLIKNKCTIRRYVDKKIPKKIINKVIDAGIWGPSLLGGGFQPWNFVVIQDKSIILKISVILEKKAENMGTGANTILRLSSKTFHNAPLLIAVYNNSTLVNFIRKINNSFVKIAKYAEVSAIAAAIQNMVLVAHRLGIGSCWHDSPLFCEKKINKLLMIKDKLVAVISLGYPMEKGKRTVRKATNEVVSWV